MWLQIHISKYILKISSKEIHRSLEIEKEENETIAWTVLLYITVYDIKKQKCNSSRSNNESLIGKHQFYKL